MLTVLYEDKMCIGVVKPVGVSSQRDPADPSDMIALLSEQIKSAVFPVHRLDKTAGGAMLYAKSSFAAGKLQAQMESGRFKKEYLAVVSGRPEKEADCLKDLLFFDRACGKSFVADASRAGAKEAVLTYTLIETVQWEENPVSLLRIRLQTGRTHQIRAQLAARGMPLLGDGKYGSTEKRCRLALWSCFVGAKSPATGKAVSLYSMPEKEYPWNLFFLFCEESSDRVKPI